MFMTHEEGTDMIIDLTDGIIYSNSKQPLCVFCCNTINYLHSTDSYMSLYWFYKTMMMIVILEIVVQSF